MREESPSKKKKKRGESSRRSPPPHTPHTPGWGKSALSSSPQIQTPSCYSVFHGGAGDLVCKQKEKRVFSDMFCSEMNMLYFRSTWTQVSKVSLELLLLFLTHLNLSLIMKCQKEMAGKGMFAILPMVSGLLPVSHCSSVKP